MPIEDYSSKPYTRRARVGQEQTFDDAAELSERGPRHARQRIEARRMSRRPRRSPLRLLGGLLVALALFVLGLPYAVDVAYGGRVLPGISVQGVSVAGVEREALRATLASRYEAFLREPVELTFEEQRWRPSMQQMGVQFDADTAVEDVMAAGRRGGPITRLQELWVLYRGGMDVAPRVVVDQGALVRYLQTLLAAVEQPPRDAALSVAEGKVIGTPASPGRQLLADETSRDIISALRQLQPETVPLRTRELAPAVDDSALAVARQNATTLLSGPITLLQGERSWTWDQKQIAELMRVEQQDRALFVGIDPDRLTRAVEQLAVQVDTGSAEPRVRFSGGALAIVQEGSIGWRLRKEDTARAISESLQLSQSITRTLALPVDQLQPQVRPETLKDLGIVELIGEGKSSFAGSADYRITNIKAGAARMDGVLIPPDSEFSFNTQLGEVDAANGFVEGYAVVGNRTQLEWGGGVCQDSTTVFRAAFWAGLPITERYAHPFYISWYDRFGLGEYGNGAGLDAAIFTGVNDLKFLNNTGHWILMQVIVDEANQVLTVQLYGTKDRTVEMQGPEISNEVPAPRKPLYVDDPARPAGTVYQSDVARGGRDITVYRIVTINGVRGAPEPFVTRFKPWPNVFVRGTG